jgi:hypothetical protein
LIDTSIISDCNKNRLEAPRNRQKEKTYLFPSPALPGSGSEGIISACINRHP